METVKRALEVAENGWKWLGKAVFAIEVGDNPLVRVRVRTVAVTATLTAVSFWLAAWLTA